MAIADMIPDMDDAQLSNLDKNARRLEGEGGAKQEQAAALRPLIDAELERRAALKPANKAPVRKAPAKKTAKAKTGEAAA
jgi:hypothetical protein